LYAKRRIGLGVRMPAVPRKLDVLAPRPITTSEITVFDLSDEFGMRKLWMKRTYLEF
jgi:hypothetical protein